MCGACFIFPAFVLALARAWVYGQYSALPQVGVLFAAIGPIATGIIVNTLDHTGKTALTSISTWVIADFCAGSPSSRNWHSSSARPACTSWPGSGFHAWRKPSST